jgi:hypothetical protein
MRHVVCGGHRAGGGGEGGKGEGVEGLGGWYWSMWKEGVAKLEDDRW